MNQTPSLTDTLREIWEETLGTEITHRDTLLDLGGTSMHALQITEQIQTEFGVVVPVPLVFDHDFAALAQEITWRRQNGAESETAMAALHRDSGPLSFAQRRLWFVHQLAPDSADYNIGFAFQLEGPLEVDVLNRALDALVERHPLLRTAIVDERGEPEQRVHAAAPTQLVAQQISESDVNDAVRREIRRPFDLTRAPLFRTRLWATPTAHVLVLTLHHLITDHQSNLILLGDLGRYYGDLLRGAPIEPASTGPDYLDYALWEQARMTAQRRADGLQFWKKAIGPKIQPFDLSPSAGPTGECSRSRAHLPAALTARLTALGALHGATLFMTLFAAWQLLLFRLSGQQIGTITVPATGRTRTELREVTGPFLNPLAFPGEIDPSMRFVDLLQRVRDTTMAAFAHQDLPIEDLVATLSPQRDGTSDPVAALKFTLEEGAPETALDLKGLQVSALDVETGIGRFDLGMEIARADGLTVTITWRRGRYDDRFAHATLTRYSNLLTAIVDAPETTVAEFDLVDAAERVHLLGLGNGNGPVIGTGALVPHLVTAWSRRTPDVIAVADRAVRFSYAEAAAVAQWLAVRLRQVGVHRGDRVALLLPASAWFPLAAWGVWQAAAAYVPLDPTWPHERLRWVLADSGAKALVRLDPEPISFWDGPQIRLQRPPNTDAISPMPAAPAADAELSSRDWAYVIYTSGTTGRPKGVVIDHHSLENVTAWHRGRFGVSRGDRCSQVFAPTFDPSVLDMWSALTAGATLDVAPAEERRDAGLLCQWLHDQQIAVAGLPTGLAEALLALPQARELPLRALLVGGDRLHWHHSDSIPWEVVNVYGPTEATIWATAATVERRTDHRPPPIGRPVDNMRAYVLDNRQRLAPVGAVGELYLAGAGVAVGYLGQAQLTAQRFVADPFVEGRMYRTGDLARWLPHGELEFLGRTDHQVKLRGHRIELQEVEAVLLHHPGITHAVAAARGERLIGYVVAPDAILGDTAELDAYLRTRLPSHLLPDALVRIDALPLTANGKIDRTALPEAPAIRAQLMPPRTPMENLLREVWHELLNIDEIGVHDDFFELGGHSLLAIRASIALRERLDLTVSVQALIENPTIERLARHIDAAQHKNIQEK